MNRLNKGGRYALGEGRGERREGVPIAWAEHGQLPEFGLKSKRQSAQRAEHIARLKLMKVGCAPMSSNRHYFSLSPIYVRVYIYIVSFPHYRMVWT